MKNYALLGILILSSFSLFATNRVNENLLEKSKNTVKQVENDQVISFACYRFQVYQQYYRFNVPQGKGTLVFEEYGLYVSDEAAMVRSSEIYNMYPSTLDSSGTGTLYMQTFGTSSINNCL